MAQDHHDINKQIVAGLDVMAEYRALGVVFAKDRPRASGKVECFAYGRDDRAPSAWVDVNTGQYGDSAGSEKAISLWEFAARHGTFSDFRDARRHYAAKAGVPTSTGRGHENPDEAIEFVEWNQSNRSLAFRWCRAHKPGTSVDAILLAGGRLGRYPRYWDKKREVWRTGRYTCICLPAFNADLNCPISWVLWNVTGEPFERKLPDGAIQHIKMRSCGPTYGTLMNIHTLQILDTAPGSVEGVIKTAGPADMLAVMDAIPPDRQDTLLVTTNASGETGDIPPETAARFAGQRVYIVHDRDAAGRVGEAKWARELAGVTNGSAQILHLPYKMVSKHGKDARDFLLGVPADDDCDESQEKAARKSDANGQWRTEGDLPGLQR